jgi:DNA-binding NtrC family response regulator
VAEGSFRPDLYYRVRVVELKLPPLRERGGDLPLLVEHFLRTFARPGCAPTIVSAAAWLALREYPFPGNVRELKHALEHGVILARGSELDVVHLPEELRSESVLAQTDSTWPLVRVLDECERVQISRVLERVGHQRMRAAELLGVSRKTLWKKMRKHGLLSAGE